MPISVLALQCQCRYCKILFIFKCLFHFPSNKSWMEAVNEPKACLNKTLLKRKKKSPVPISTLWFLNIPFVWTLNTHEDSQNGYVKNLIGFHSDFLHLFKMFFSSSLSLSVPRSLLKMLKIWEARRGILLRGEQHSQILNLIPLAAAQTATDRHIISWGVLAPQPTSKHRTEPLLCSAAF